MQKLTIIALGALCLLILAGLFAWGLFSSPSGTEFFKSLPLPLQIVLGAGLLALAVFWLWPVSTQDQPPRRKWRRLLRLRRPTRGSTNKPNDN